MKKSDYDNKYAKENYDRVIVQVRKGQKALIEAHYREKGYKSMNSYITELIENDMRRNTVQKNQTITINDNNGTINM